MATARGSPCSSRRATGPSATTTSPRRSTPSGCSSRPRSEPSARQPLEQPGERVELLVGVAVREQLGDAAQVRLARAAEEVEPRGGEGDEESAGVVGALDALDEPPALEPLHEPGDPR